MFLFFFWFLVFFEMGSFGMEKEDGRAGGRDISCPLDFFWFLGSGSFFIVWEGKEDELPGGFFIFFFSRSRSSFLPFNHDSGRFVLSKPGLSGEWVRSGQAGWALLRSSFAALSSEEWILDTDGHKRSVGGRWREGYWSGMGRHGHGAWMGGFCFIFG